MARILFLQVYDFVIKVRHWAEILEMLCRYNGVTAPSKSEKFMQANVTNRSRFHRGEKVHFIGGAGTVRSSKLECNRWNYLIEMDMGPEPEMGRIGYETTIWLPESDINSIENSLIYHLASA